MKKQTPPKEMQRRFREAREHLQKMQEEIAPFIKVRKFKKYSNKDEWRETSSLYSQDYNFAQCGLCKARKR
ncbi:MAG: hypothetical protein AEth_00885 [Candidatus Argoarchaeum ethanivorans]|uniref:Uncharacterized protein n=1 Tax=Candidatus Argoarchaeum ethanivorans TaxID=2608793 RepID=A0A8B3S3Z9_9EURY|nr:MAG: hypothetical protein AEth_00885 [Candidatus Argoarchaeum ethanivorans]